MARRPVTKMHFRHALDVAGHSRHSRESEPERELVSSRTHLMTRCLVYYFSDSLIVIYRPFPVARDIYAPIDHAASRFAHFAANIEL